MTLDLAQLRRLAEESRSVLPEGTASVVNDAEHAAFYRWVAASSPSVVLELLDRLERAEERLANARAHWRITAGSMYPLSGMGRILGEEGE